VSGEKRWRRKGYKKEKKKGEHLSHYPKKNQCVYSKLNNRVCVLLFGTDFGTVPLAQGFEFLSFFGMS
jgi:hypothetical protein